jgi:diaminohydroxyphosphoribosylaminopyrimidine deaminase / 5-amino-6-(5-phosphoribosylamino)uracil reductase
MNDQFFMEMALDLAEKGRGYTSPNPMVGAVVVADGKVVGKGYHEAAGRAHAEVRAIDDAGEKANGATLYVTLEPCHHHGRTPPCTEKILAAGIHRVVVAMADPNPAVTGGGSDYLEAKGLQMTLGICEQRALRLNESFVKHAVTGRPFVTLKCAATLDGRIATRTGDSRWVTGEMSRQFVHKLRHASDAIMVGIGTVRKDNPSLTTRLDIHGGRDPLRIILDTGLGISEKAGLLNLDSNAGTLIVCGDTISHEKRHRIEETGASVLEAPLKDGGIHLDLLMNILGERNVSSLLIEGGSRVIASALAAGIVDKVFFFYAPKILGGDDGVPICRGPGAVLMKDSIGIKEINVTRFDDDVMIEGYIDREGDADP